ncbi:hypothetical protein AGMMS49573_04520 [Endomicrobiia bacterium]|nr:hypothetical protein AGMMS49532_08600 [Endomicrobiia bacterium]GHT16072.1 hypothetical protein AGMMS49573_04520 [Endomicrobiia bacterium]GHT23095.1 hypothetical protein AGMMS49953_03070 [Endomicrobiia bacterium]
MSPLRNILQNYNFSRSIFESRSKSTEELGEINIRKLVTIVMMSGMISIVSQIASAVGIIKCSLHVIPTVRSVVNKTGDERIYGIRYVFRFDLKGFENGI